MFGVNNYKQFNWTLYLVFAFSVIGFLVAIQGANAPVHHLKPVVSFLWVALFFFTLSNKTIVCSKTNICWFLVIYALGSAIVTAGLSYNSLSSMLTGEFYFLPYISLLYGCFVYDGGLLVSLKRIMFISLLSFILILVMFRDMLIQESALSAIADMAEQGLSLDTVTKYFCFSSGLLLLLFPVISKKCKLVVVIAFALSVFASIFLARRNLIVTNFLFIGMAVVIYLKNNKNRSILQKIIIYGALAFVALNVFDLAVSIFTGTNESDFFSQLINRVDSDSRTHVLIPYYSYMNESPFYWIFGHGINAHYESVAFGSRTVIETGYLQIIMKIGLVGLVLYFILLFGTVKSSFRGNILMQACSAFIVISILETIYAGVPMFGLTWIVLWICIGICQSNELISLSNEEIRNILCN